VYAIDVQGTVYCAHVFRKIILVYVMRDCTM